MRETLDIDSFDHLNFLIGLHEALGVDIPGRRLRAAHDAGGHHPLSLCPLALRSQRRGMRSVIGIQRRDHKEFNGHGRAYAGDGRSALAGRTAGPAATQTTRVLHGLTRPS